MEVDKLNFSSLHGKISKCLKLILSNFIFTQILQNIT